ncbi:hypothetical protein D3C86_1368240 [compost metagenome]
MTDPKDKLLAIFDYHIERQEIRQFGGCPFIKANDEAGTSDPRVLTEIQATKTHSKAIIKKLVTASGHQQNLTDQELTELIFFTLEGALTSVSVFKQTAELKAAKKIIKKLI